MAYIIPRKIPVGGVTITIIKVIVYLAAFAAVIGIAVAIAFLSVFVAPVDARDDGLTLLAIAVGGMGVAGGVVYLAEKLINLAKGVGFMLAELIVEKFKKREREIGREKGLAEGRIEERRAWQAWYERQQTALRNGRPFNEPPPGHSPELPGNGREHPDS